MKSIFTNSAIKGLAIVFSCFFSCMLISQPAIQWQKCYGGTKLENSYASSPTSDGGAVVIGESKSSDGNVSMHHSGTASASDQDVWIVKTNSLGNIDWERSYGGTNSDVGAAIKQTSDGGYIFIGTTTSTDGDVSGGHGSYDLWLVKLDANGNIQWQKCLGGSGFDSGRAIELTADGGYIVAGVVSSNDGDVSGLHGTYPDAWLVKLDASGSIEWQKCFGGTSQEGAQGLANNGSNFNRMSIIQSNDGGYFLGTHSTSIDGDVTGHHGPGGLVMVGLVSHWDADYWVVKIDGLGVLQWQKSIGGTNEEYVYSVLQAADGGFVIAGSTMSTDGDVVGQLGAGLHAWIVKIDSTGVIQWKKFVGNSTNASWPYSISKTSDGGYFSVGRRGSDYWGFKLDGFGNLLWQKIVGGTGSEYGTAGFETSDGGYFLSGHSSSNNGDVSGNHGAGDFWLVKLFPSPTNVITGTIYEDLNGNCQQDSLELGLSGQIVRAMPGNYFATTDNNGNYSLFVDTGAFVVTHAPSSIYNNVCPSPLGTYNVNITTLNPSSFSNDFADTLNTHCTDVKVSVATAFLRKCRKNNYAIVYKNAGALTANNVSVTVDFDADLIPLSSNIAWTLSNNQYTFNLGTLAAGVTGAIIISDSVSCSANSGDVKCITAKITTSDAECDTLNNTDHECHMIIASCDPNGLEVQSQIPNAGYVLQENISAADSLSYIIRFQNTGTDTAYTVVVRDTLSNFLDASTIELGASSHAYTFRIYGQGICEWTFNNILLPDSTTNELNSHGFLKFKVKQAANNLPGTTIYNGASIWFDYNQSLATNTTNNFIPIPSGVQVVGDANSSILVFPNPTNGVFKLRLIDNKKIDSDVAVTIYNSLGVQVFSQNHITSSVNELSINLEGQSNGVYMIRVLKNGEMTTTKFIKQN